MNAFVVDPVDCIITYSCVSNTGSRTDLCSVNQNGGLTLASFDSDKGDFSFKTTELDVQPLDAVNPGFAPGTYVVTIEATSGGPTSSITT